MQAQGMSVGQLVDENASFDREVVRAAKSMARAKPWRGTLDERKAKFETAARELAEALGVENHRVVFGVLDGGDSIGSQINQRHRVLLTGRLSVVTLFFLLAARSATHGMHPMKFAVNLFRVAFPLSFARCDLSGAYVRNNQRQSMN